MTAETITALFALAFASTWTPGPNNAMLASSGASFGIRRSLPHMAGVAFGFPAMLFLVALGLGELFRHSSLLREALRWGGAAMLLWIAWRVANSGPPGSGAKTKKPLTFMQAVAFQWINPKAWIMCLAVVGQFVGDNAGVWVAVICAGVFTISGVGSASSWAIFGAGIGKLLAGGWKLRLFNWSMAAMILAGVAMLAVADLAPH